MAGNNMNLVNALESENALAEQQRKERQEANAAQLHFKTTATNLQAEEVAAQVAAAERTSEVADQQREILASLQGHSEQLREIAGSPLLMAFQPILELIDSESSAKGIGRKMAADEQAFKISQQQQVISTAEDESARRLRASKLQLAKTQYIGESGDVDMVQAEITANRDLRDARKNLIEYDLPNMSAANMQKLVTSGVITKTQRDNVLRGRASDQHTVKMQQVQSQLIELQGMTDEELKKQNSPRARKVLRSRTSERMAHDASVDAKLQRKINKADTDQLIKMLDDDDISVQQFNVEVQKRDEARMGHQEKRLALEVSELRNARMIYDRSSPQEQQRMLNAGAISQTYAKQREQALVRQNQEFNNFMENTHQNKLKAADEAKQRWLDLADTGVVAEMLQAANANGGTITHQNGMVFSVTQLAERSKALDEASLQTIVENSSAQALDRGVQVTGNQIKSILGLGGTQEGTDVESMLDILQSSPGLGNLAGELASIQTMHAKSENPNISAGVRMRLLEEVNTRMLELKKVLMNVELASVPKAEQPGATEFFTKGLISDAGNATAVLQSQVMRGGTKTTGSPIFDVAMSEIKTMLGEKHKGLSAQTTTDPEVKLMEILKMDTTGKRLAGAMTNEAIGMAYEAAIAGMKDEDLMEKMADPNSKLHRGGVLIETNLFRYIMERSEAAKAEGKSVPSMADYRKAFAMAGQKIFSRVAIPVGSKTNVLHAALNKIVFENNAEGLLQANLNQRIRQGTVNASEAIVRNNRPGAQIGSRIMGLFDGRPLTEF